MKFLFLLIINLYLLFSSSYRPEDYFVDVGLGFSYDSNRYHDTKFLASSFKLGKNITNQFSLFYYDVFSFSNIFYKSSSSGFGSTYYFSPIAKSSYLTLGYGNYSKVGYGIASNLIFGLGYEINNNYHFELTLFYSDINGFLPKFTFNRIFY